MLPYMVNKPEHYSLLVQVVTPTNVVDFK